MTKIRLSLTSAAVMSRPSVVNLALSDSQIALIVAGSLTNRVLSASPRAGDPTQVCSAFLQTLTQYGQPTKLSDTAEETKQKSKPSRTRVLRHTRRWARKLAHQ